MLILYYKYKVSILLKIIVQNNLLRNNAFYIFRNIIIEVFDNYYKLLFTTNKIYIEMMKH